MTQSNRSTIQEVSPALDYIQNSELLSALLQPQGLILLGILAFLGIASFFRDGGAGGVKATKNALASGEFGGKKELNSAKKVALKQMSKQTRSPVSLFIGEPNNKPFGGTDPVYIPDANRSIMVMGAAGIGKTFASIDPLVMSAIRQGFPILLYDFKFPDQTSILGTYAALNGYQVDVLAPGYSESGVLNPITAFIKDATSGLSASQLSEVLNANFKKQGSSGEDGFFGPSGNQLVKATMLLARTMKYPDLITCAKILSVNRLGQKIIQKRGDMNQWIADAFGQFTSSAGSEKTEASIQSTAQLVFNRFLVPELLSVLCGESNISTKLEGKRMLVLGLDQDKRDVLAPLFATITNLIINQNMAYKRNQPLVFAADEIPTMYLPNLPKWPNEHRSKGFCMIAGVQNKTQLEGTYGAVQARTIMGAFATKILMNPQDIDTAKWMESSLPQKEVIMNTKNKSVNSGKATFNYNQDVRTRSLITAGEINQLGQGDAILINPHFKNKKSSYVPIKHHFAPPQKYHDLRNYLEEKWYSTISPYLISNAQERGGITESDLKVRQEEVDKMFPEQSPQTNTETSKLLKSLL